MLPAPPKPQRRLLAMENTDAANHFFFGDRPLRAVDGHDDVEVVVQGRVGAGTDPAEFRRTAERVDDLVLDLAPFEEEPPVVRP